MTALAAFMTLMLVAAAPAFAHHKPDHEVGGPASSNSQQPAEEASNEVGTDVPSDDEDGATFTEDTDTNDDSTPNNVSDEGDNAHPSGQDRSVENGGSGNQGDAQANPDDTNGPKRSEGEPGADEPNGPGGTDLADQDGNNGCGNDDDFDDDNNGNCGPRVKDDDESTDEDEEVDESPVVIEEPGDEEVPTPVVDVPETDTDASPRVEEIVLGTRIPKGQRVAVSAAPAVEADQVTRGAALPSTGISLTMFLMVALALLATGLTTLRLLPAKIRQR